MSPTAYGTFGNQAVMYAGIVYTLALLSHIVEWTIRQPARAVPPTKVVVNAGGGPAQSVAGPPEPASDRGALAGHLGVNLTVVAFGLHLAGVVARGLAAERVPWGNMYEFTLVGALGVVGMYLVMLRRYRLGWLGLPVTGFLVLVLMLDTLILYAPPGPLVPALQSYWLVIHVTAAMLATGAFTLGALLSVLFLVKQRAETRGTSSAGFLARLPPAEDMDEVAFRVHAFGFPVWTFAALVAGPIWAEHAWGRYWGWDPKEVWAFITWVLYAAYLHARATAGCRGNVAAAIALVGFASLLFNFVGINYFFGSGSLHSYSGR